MKWVALLAAVLVVLAAPSVAQGAVSSDSAEVVVDDGSPDHPYQRWVNRAQVPSPPGALILHEAPCDLGTDHATGCTYPDLPEIWVDPAVPWVARATFIHELGHQFDYRVMTPSARGEFQAILGDARAWTDQGAGTVRELFAEAYTICARWKSWREEPDERLYSETIGTVGVKRQRQLCRVIWSFYQ